jgi:hypothetical protein
VTRDPFASTPTTARLWAAAVLCALSMGMAWSSAVGYSSLDALGPCAYDQYCVPIFRGGYVSPGSVTTVSAAPVRLFVVAAVLGLVVAAARARTQTTQRLARVATVALTVALALALGHGSGPVALLLALALVLAAPPAWRTRVPAR